MNALPHGRTRNDGWKLVCKIAKDLKALQNPIHSVLVVEDEFFIRLMIGDYLTERGFRVIEASNADDAIELLEGNYSTVDVVFSDVHMPGKTDGFGLARWIRANRPGTSVLLASGVARKSCALAQDFPADSFVEKPYDVRRVADKIQCLAEAMH